MTFEEGFIGVGGSQMRAAIVNQDMAPPKAPGEQRIDSLKIETIDSIVSVRHW